MVLTKGGDVQRDNAGASDAWKHESAKARQQNKKKLTLGRGQCSGCWGNTEGARGGRVTDTWKRVSAREKKTMQIRKKNLPGVLAGDVGVGRRQTMKNRLGI